MVINNESCFAEIITDKSPTCVEFFHQKQAGPAFLAYSWDNYVTLSVLHFPQLENDFEEFNHENLTDVKHDCSVLKVAWSPKTSMVLHPVGLIFCTICVDHQIRIVSLDNKMEVTMSVIGKHKTFINDCAFEPTTGDILASVGDDKKCNIWSIEGNLEHCIPLTSPGKTVRWNTSDVGKLMIAEQNGCIRVYDSANYMPIFSLTCIPTSGLSSCDWSLVDPMKFGAIIGKNWYVWDISKGSLPQLSSPAHTDGGQEFRWCQVSKDVFSTRGRPGNETKIYMSVDGKANLTISTKVGCGMSWHNLLSICAVGSNRKILLFDLEAVG